jgi:hypothetical protein
MEPPAKRVRASRYSYFSTVSYLDHEIVKEILEKLVHDDYLKWFRMQEERGELGMLHNQICLKLGEPATASAVCSRLKRSGLGGFVNEAKDIVKLLEYVRKNDTATGKVAEDGEMGSTKSEAKTDFQTKLAQGKTQRLMEVKDLFLKNKMRSETKLLIINEYPHLISEMFEGENIALTQLQEERKLRMKEEADNVAWRPWQEKLNEELDKDPDPRKVIVVYDADGNTGKTYFSKMWCHSHPGEGVVVENGKSNDLKYILSRYPNLKCMFFDLSRSNIEHVNYGFVEDIKNGRFTSGKYVSREVTINVPHVVIFTNFKLDFSSMSADRWCAIFPNHPDPEIVSGAACSSAFE